MLEAPRPKVIKLLLTRSQKTTPHRVASSPTKSDETNFLAVQNETGFIRRSTRRSVPVSREGMLAWSDIQLEDKVSSYQEQGKQVQEQA